MLRRALQASALALVLLCCTSLRAQYRVVHLERPFNTAGSETGAVQVGDTVLVYASMEQPTSRNSQFRVHSAHTNLYQARLAKNGKLGKPRLNRWGLNDKHFHTSNLCIDPISQDLYFTRADKESLRAEIYYCRKKSRRGWEKPVRMGGSINLDGYTATQPTIGRLADSTTLLYFASDRPGGSGGMDIWYVIVKNGKVQGECVNLGPQVNTPADEITPFYDQPNGVLYFSSDRMGGMGGFDVYCAVGARNAWHEAEPVCQCLNSEYNDIYFTITHRDTATGMPTAGYLASNRTDSYFLVDSTCCNDLYRWAIDTSALLRTVGTDTIESSATLISHVRRFMFPLFLYFHNDEPDPMSRLATTATPYDHCQQHYATLRADYLAHQSSAQDSALVEEFFDSCVVGNYQRVEQLFDYIESLLDDGHRITLTIAGYASPVFHSEYNQVLSQRRIASFVNLIRSWHSGTLAGAMEDGTFRIVERPHGAVEPTTESRSTDPVYGLPAALARRIEILSCEVEGEQ